MMTGLKDLPQSTKKKIVIGGTAGIMLVIIIVWATSLRQVFVVDDQVTPIVNQQDWEDFQQSLNQAVDRGQTEIEKISDQLATATSTATTTPESSSLSPEEKDILIQKLLELKAQQQESN